MTVSSFFLSDLAPGQGGRIIALAVQGPIRQRLIDLGFLPGTTVQALFAGARGNPVAYRIRGTTIALRLEGAKQIQLQPVPKGGNPFA